MILIYSCDIISIGLYKECLKGGLTLEKIVDISCVDNLDSFFGNLDENIKIIEEELNVEILVRDSNIKILGDENVKGAFDIIKDSINRISKGEDIEAHDIRYSIALYKDKIPKNDLSKDLIFTTPKGKPIKPKTIGQEKYCNAIKNNTITIAVGPAGTGKTYLAVALAVKAFKAHEVEKIIITRPAVEAGESLGFLPGDLQQKIDPYLRPIYDALFDMLGPDVYKRYAERGNIEVAPLAYMRGRTLEDSFIILDEAQNTTREQMKMFLTRLGFGSKMVITGDVTQIDLPMRVRSGLKDAIRILKNIKGIAQINFNDKDVVRHKLVQDIIKAYEKEEKGK